MTIDINNIVVLEWTDAQADVGWQEDVKAHLSDCITVGFIVDETKDAICIASTYSDPHSNARMHIPKKWVKSRRSVYIGSDNEIQASIRAAIIGSLPGISDYTISDGTNTWKWDANASSFVALQDGNRETDVL
jgi:hypothetical protein